MKNIDLTITELAASVPKAVREAETLGVRGITRNGRGGCFSCVARVTESILETMELQKNSELMGLVALDRAGKMSFAKVPPCSAKLQEIHPGNAGFLKYFSVSF